MQSLRAVNRKVVAGFENGFFYRVSIHIGYCNIYAEFKQTINRQISNFDQLCLTPKAFIYFFLVKMLLPLPKLRFLYALMQIVFQIGGFQLSTLYF